MTTQYSTGPITAQAVELACRHWLNERARRIQIEHEKLITDAMKPRGWFKRTRTYAEARAYVVNGEEWEWAKHTGIYSEMRIQQLYTLSKRVMTIQLCAQDAELLQHALTPMRST